MAESELHAWKVFYTASNDPCFLMRAEENRHFELGRVNDSWECATGICPGFRG